MNNDSKRIQFRLSVTVTGQAVRVDSRQWYVNMPAAVAEAMEFQKGEVVEWIIDDQQLIKWIGKKHKLGYRESYRKLQVIRRENPTLFYHWPMNY